MPTENHPSSEGKRELAFADAIESGLPKTVETVNGETITVPKISWRMRITGLKIISEVYNEIFRGTEEGEKFTLTDAYSAIVTRCPEYLTKLVSLVIGQSEEWVLDNLDDTTVLEVALPFFVRSISIRDRMMREMVPEIGLIAEAVKSGSIKTSGE